ncbi:YqiA/YcfP family alpha/beta fold hydrolase [Dechloromonas denitrificans]|uniref:YqiA/YcfP family alpha/beta fold hydrolase n=1 Tax=Dechloromonas denitrificans TaxID=281362 RepID=UPI001CF90DF6|nr:YqiA/YcfP family alpha/beta fold hydrolase [Dechloromonas denitrificans]UCV03452.1 alpha/beta fold hydrolase [Dechloromonas denitrificans]UCV07711.1 alpha/beta fold hydrolase [Dechloromonas denitrificans]
MGRDLILYLHGFCSSPASWKARRLGEFMAERGLAAHFVCPQLSPVPDEAMAAVSALIEAASGPVTLVGSSLGGHYANHLAEKYDLKAVLINPAVVDVLDLGSFIGEQHNFHSGERFIFSEQHAAQLRAQVSRPRPERYWLLLEEGDEVLDYRQAQAFYAGCRQTVLAGGDHSFTKFPDFMPQILEFAGL